MCYQCTHCNKCGKFPPVGTCVKCGYLNEPDARVCAGCGAEFPKKPAPPGVSNK
jgi:hypothetical protein